MGSPRRKTRGEVAEEIKARIHAGEWKPRRRLRAGATLAEDTTFEDRRTLPAGTVLEVDMFLPADRLPSTNELGKQHGVHERTASEAAGMLVREGLLRTTPGGSRYVIGPDDDDE